jgi:hypothetical protein
MAGYYADSSVLVKRHVAAALEANSRLTVLGAPPLTFLSADNALLAAAAAEGLAIDNPNLHP